MKVINYDNEGIIYIIKIGENAEDNWNLIDSSKQNDIWFHADNVPSCHVVLCVNNKIKPHKSVLNYCAKLCRMNTKNTVNSVIYTEIKNVKKSDKVGSVTTKKTRLIY